MKLKKLFLIMFLSTLISALSIVTFKVSAETYVKQYLNWETINYYGETWGVQVTEAPFDIDDYNTFYLPPVTNALFSKDGIDSSFTFTDSTGTETQELELTFSYLNSKNVLFSLASNNQITFSRDFIRSSIEDIREITLAPTYVVTYDTVTINIVQKGDYDGGYGVPSNLVVFYVENAYFSNSVSDEFVPVTTYISDYFDELNPVWKIFIPIALVIMISLGLFIMKVNVYIIFILDMVAVTLFFALGWIPSWLIILFAIVLTLLIFLSLKKGGD